MVNPPTSPGADFYLPTENAFTRLLIKLFILVCHITSTPTCHTLMTEHIPIYTYPSRSSKPSCNMDIQVLYSLNCKLPRLGMGEYVHCLAKHVVKTEYLVSNIQRRVSVDAYCYTLYRRIRHRMIGLQMLICYFA